MKKWAQKQKGFTIVELLIVIVVIAILAAITIVAFNGIRQSATDSALKSNLSQQLRKLSEWKTKNNETYPLSLTEANNASMLVSSSQATYVEYMVSPDQQNYCATATAGNNVAYSITSKAGSPLPGRCVENLVTNPSFEVDTAGWTLGGAVPTVNRVTGGQMGEYRLAMTKASPVNDSQYNNTGPLAADTAYSVAYWAWSDNASCNVGNQFSRNNTTFVPFVVISGNLATSPTIYRGTGTAPAGSTQYRWRIVPCQSGTGTVYYDGFTAVRASFQLKTPYDGDSTGWFWTGTPHASTSIGPAEAL